MWRQQCAARTRSACSMCTPTRWAGHQVSVHVTPACSFGCTTPDIVRQQSQRLQCVWDAVMPVRCASLRCLHARLHALGTLRHNAILHHMVHNTCQVGWAQIAAGGWACSHVLC